MKNWTLEDLYELWRDRGYSKKQAKAMAEKDFNEMHRKKSDIAGNGLQLARRKAFPGFDSRACFTS